jgi:hypothetical protein
MLPAKAISNASNARQSADNPVTDMPLYAIMLPDGHIEIIDPRDIEDTPCPTLTESGARETKSGAREEAAEHLIGYLRDHTFEAGFLIKLIEEAADARANNTKTLDDCYAAYAQIFLQLEHCLKQSGVSL